MNIVFVLGEYYPNFSAVGKCASMVANILAKNNNVKVICFKSNSNDNNYDSYNNQVILRTYTKEFLTREKFITKIKQNKNVLRLFYKILYNIFKIKIVFKILFSKETIYKEKVNALYNTLISINDKIDIIIPCCFPMESIVAALKYKKNNSDVQLIPYLFDPFTENLTLHRFNINKRIKRKSHLKLESEMIKASKKVIVMKHLYNHFINDFFDSNKIIIADHPLLTDKCNGNDGQNINLIYTGIFQKIVRNPFLFLKLMEEVLKNIDGVLHIYAYGNCDNIIDKFAINNPKKIIFHGKVSNDIAENALKNGNIFISVGNKDNTQVPSKVIEYIGYGKPIIHFYTNPHDECINILKKYPLALIIDLNGDVNVNLIDIISFCNNNKNNSLKFVEVKENFLDALPEFIIKMVFSYD